MVSTPRKRTPQEIENTHLSNKPPRDPAKIWVCLHNIRSLHNVGSAFRSCDAFAAGNLLLSGFTPCPPRPEIAKTALGADAWVPWQQLPEGAAALKKYQDLGYRIIAVEQTNQSVPLPEMAGIIGDAPCIFVFGNEVLGIDDEILQMADLAVEIPQYGKKHSLNVSVSVGIVLFAAQNMVQANSAFQ